MSEPPALEKPSGIRRELYSGTHFSKLRCGFKYRYLMARPPQEEGKGETTDTRSDDGNRQRYLFRELGLGMGRVNVGNATLQ